MQKNTTDKSDLRTYVKQIIVQKIEKSEKFLEFTIEASRDTKKTPKYDSIREEIQDEIYRMQKQLGFLIDLQQKMAKVLNAPTVKVQLGSLVITNKARFYISVSLGEFFFEGNRFYAISEESPLYKIMCGKMAGEFFELNNISQIIEEVL